MPELPEVETTKNGLQPLLGQTVRAVTVHQPKLRWAIPNDIDRLVGTTLLGLQRRSKYIIADFGQQHMLWHLGMSGSFRLAMPDEPLRKHDHLIIAFEQQQLRYHDPRRFGCVLWLDEYHDQKLLQPLGVEPLSDDFTAEYLQEKLKNKKVAIKIALMDAHIVVGVGNIYATESLFNSGIHPLQPAHSVTLAQLQQLVYHVRKNLLRAIELGGSSLRDYVNSTGESGYFQQTLLAYGRAGQPCINCQTPLENLRIGQRASVFCPQCQPLLSENV